jgi:hypothetical protein
MPALFLSVAERLAHHLNLRQVFSYLRSAAKPASDTFDRRSPRWQWGHIIGRRCRSRYLLRPHLIIVEPWIHLRALKNPARYQSRISIDALICGPVFRSLRVKSPLASSVVT